MQKFQPPTLEIPIYFVFRSFVRSFQSSPRPVQGGEGGMKHSERMSGRISGTNGNYADVDTRYSILDTVMALANQSVASCLVCNRRYASPSEREAPTDNVCMSVCMQHNITYLLHRTACSARQGTKKYLLYKSAGSRNIYHRYFLSSNPGTCITTYCIPYGLR